MMEQWSSSSSSWPSTRGLVLVWAARVVCWTTMLHPAATLVVQGYTMGTFHHQRLTRFTAAAATSTATSFRRHDFLRLEAAATPSSSSSSSSRSSNTDPQNSSGTTFKSKKKKPLTVADLSARIQKNPAKYVVQEEKKKKAKKYRRTRRRVEHPQQQYLYKSQRQQQQQSRDNNHDEDPVVVTEKSTTDRRHVDLARELGLQQTVHCDALDDVPCIMGRVRVDDNNYYAYVLDKPAGWAILGRPAKKKHKSQTTNNHKPKRDDKSVKTTTTTTTTRVKVVDEGTVDVLEYSEDEILAVMTPEEIEEYYEAMELEGLPVEKDKVTKGTAWTADNDSESIEPSSEVEENNRESSHDHGGNRFANPVRQANVRRIVQRSTNAGEKSVASFATTSRPSLVTWLKNELQEKQGIIVRGGNTWTAVSGACEVDDSGLVLVCPKDCVDNLCVENATYTAVAGTSGRCAPTGKHKSLSAAQKQGMEFEVLSKLRKGRKDDVVETVRFDVPDGASTCSNAVEICAQRLGQGIRGDPEASPLDRRAWRRLIHCNGLSVSSLVCDESVNVYSEVLPSDITVLSDRNLNVKATKLFEKGSFIGRNVWQQSTNTNAYREINGAADGLPGWIVDRYDKWLIVQHDSDFPKGPLPSIHDGNTAGVYYMPSVQDRSTIGPNTSARPTLVEGQSAPGEFAVTENGAKYLVSLDKDLSTGLFLDQRPQRQWLSKNCCADTRVLNCFAHTGAFSVVAAAAGASTVSLDLSQKWLDRLPRHFKENGLEFDERHDAIYGDCFDWMVRLAKRGEKYDIVILDPPSTSVGGRKKKRWSVKKDMDELVTLASKLVRAGGLLWTTTNSASLSVDKMARLCQKGLQDAGHHSARLEKIQPMPSDFPTVGPQPVKNLVWRLP